ncbi:DUF4062 domain-containing protein [Photobacterium sp. GB-210]|uniref:DUF4062 domain-containing protein n=1 Tax=Photobacterium sp. GB-210 TaxID=2022104 RepID=UPI000D15710D|nr:DUF4062 domain-containing protein [Photobacterium sp. GB-210]PSV38508.1 hypothetical protein C9J38_08510 [Photobacterium sp. GB-210]
MAKLRVFVSSTCYDLGIVRSELRPFIASLGYDPVMSDYSDILYDPRSHTHESCIKEVPNCDMVVLIIGPRFGGTGIPSLLEEFDFTALKDSSSKSAILDNKDKLSITQLEILKAVEKSIPVYAFVDEKVLHDHNVYEKNKDKPKVMEEIEFPSIQKKHTATYIFEFINFLTHRTTNNSVIGFSKLEDIKNTLVGQWSQLFQRLLYEDRNKSIESKRYIDFSDRIEDLKTVVLASIATPNLRETARGAIQYRRLMSFLAAFRAENYRELLVSDFSWSDLLKELEIIDIKEVEVEKGYRPQVFLVKADGTFYSCRYPLSFVLDMEADWRNFTDLDKETREAIVDASLQDRDIRRFKDLRYSSQQFEEHMEELKVTTESSENVEIV